MRWKRRPWVVVTTAMAAVLIGAALLWVVRTVSTQDSGWMQWTTAAVLIAVLATAGMAVLLGPIARRLAGDPHRLTARDRKRLTVKDRIDALNNARATLLQSATGFVVVVGLIFTGAGLVYTARTLDVSVRTLDATREGQITDRYTKAVEQLGSSKVDVRLGGIYALQRLGRDSERDRSTIVQVLAAYVRVHAHPPKSDIIKGQPLVDVAAALETITVLDRDQQRFDFDLTRVDFHSLDLTGVNLSGAILTEAKLGRTNLSRARLTDTFFNDSDLSYANLANADMTHSFLYGANLAGAIMAGVRLPLSNLSSTMLAEADLSNADLTHTSLARADLSGIDLRHSKLVNADLSGAQLGGAQLAGADLSGADMTDVLGARPADIKALARTSPTTKFS